MNKETRLILESQELILRTFMNDYNTIKQDDEISSMLKKLDDLLNPKQEDKAYEASL